MDLPAQHKTGRRKTASRQPRRSRNRQGLNLGLTAIPTNKLLLLVQRGVPYKMLGTVSAQTGIPTQELATLIEIPERTLARRRVTGKLDRNESERLLRLARVVSSSVRLFEGDVDAAVVWLKTPLKALSHNTPLSYARFEIGAREVEDLIGRLEHGVFS